MKKKDYFTIFTIIEEDMKPKKKFEVKIINWKTNKCSYIKINLCEMTFQIIFKLTNPIEN